MGASLVLTSNPTGAKICFCERLALILTFSAWEKDQLSLDAGFADALPASPAAGFSKRQPTIHPLPRQWKRDGVRVACKMILNLYCCIPVKQW